MAMDRNSDGVAKDRNTELLRTMRKKGCFSIFAYRSNAYTSRYISVSIRRQFFRIPIPICVL